MSSTNTTGKQISQQVPQGERHLRRAFFQNSERKLRQHGILEVETRKWGLDSRKLAAGLEERVITYTRTGYLVPGRERPSIRT